MDHTGGQEGWEALAQWGSETAESQASKSMDVSIYRLQRWQVSETGV